MRLRSLIALAILFSPSAALAQDEVVYFHTDAIGSVRMVTDASGAVVARYDYLPFGELWPTVPPNQNPDVRQFTGKERDPETGLDYFGARYMRAQSGRFTTVDPALDLGQAVLDPQLWNRYHYARNNPMKFVDPDGREIWLSSAHQRALSAAGRRAAPAAAVAIAAGAIAAAIEAGPIAWRAAYGCYLSAFCQSQAIGIAEGLAGGSGPSSVPFSPSSAARSFGLVGDMTEAGSLFGGRLANGANVAVNFSRTGDTLGVNISVVSGRVQGTLALLEQGAINAARGSNLSTVRITATAPSEVMARFLRMNGFVEKNGVWMKEIEVR